MHYRVYCFQFIYVFISHLRLVFFIIIYLIFAFYHITSIKVLYNANPFAALLSALYSESIILYHIWNVEGISGSHWISCGITPASWSSTTKTYATQSLRARGRRRFTRATVFLVTKRAQCAFQNHKTTNAKYKRDLFAHFVRINTRVIPDTSENHWRGGEIIDVSLLCFTGESARSCPLVHFRCVLCKQRPVCCLLRFAIGKLRFSWWIPRSWFRKCGR